MDERRPSSVVGGRYIARTDLTKTELSYIKDLLDDFGCTTDTPELVLNTISKRYEALDRIVDVLPYPTDTATWLGYAKGIHNFLFSGLMTFAVTFRSATDRGGGRVYFGGQHNRERKHKFEGISTHRINADLVEAFDCLVKAANPAQDAIYFYWRWSFIHPFYDANGRIARILIMLFLFHHGKEINWITLDRSHSKFMKKLNDCHKVAHEKKILNELLVYLYNFWLPHISSYDPIGNY